MEDEVVGVKDKELEEKKNGFSVEVEDELMGVEECKGLAEENKGFSVDVED